MTDPFHTPEVDAEVASRALTASDRRDKSQSIDRRINGILVGIALVVLVTLALAAIYFPQFASRTNDLSQSTRIQGCRSQSNAQVTNARTEFDVARANRDTAATRLNLLIAEGLVDVARSDEVALAELLPNIESARTAVSNAEGDVVSATRALRAAQEEHQIRTDQSISNPRQYLIDCRNFAPNGG